MQAVNQPPPPPQFACAKFWEKNHVARRPSRAVVSRAGPLRADC
jgi:hypothetical protein